MNNKCQMANHAQRAIITICLAPQCQDKRICCSKCLTDFHKDHMDQIVDFYYLKDFLKTQSLKPNTTQENVTSQEFNDILKNMENLAKLIRQEIQRLSSLNSQSFWKDLENRYSIINDQIGNQQWNELTQEMLSHIELREGEIFEKLSNVTPLPCSHNMNQFQQALKRIVHELKTGNQVTSQNHNIIDQNQQIIEQNNPQIIDLNPFKQLTVSHLLKGHTDLITAIDICEQRNLLVSGSLDQTVKLWNLQDNKLIQTYKDTSSVHDVVFSREGNLIAYGGYSDVINLVEIDDLKKSNTAQVLKGHSDSVTKLIFSINSMYLASGSFDETVRIWNVKTKQELFKLETGSIVFGLAINREITIIVSNSQTIGIQIWNFLNQKLLCTHKDDQCGAAIQFSNDQEQLISSGFQGNIKIWSLKDLNQGKLLVIKELQVANTMIQTLLLTPDSRFIISYSYQDKSVKVIDSNTSKSIMSFQVKYQETEYYYTVGGITISKKMDAIVFGSGKEIEVWRQK